jgi:UDP-2-acetamido-2-deoxy-ribo-hexuluronate aminotransferase
MKSMREIRMVDLKAQYELISDEIDQAVLDMLRSTQFINGPAVKSFQDALESYLGVSHVIPCANGTDALQVCMMALGLRPGDEVITASFTYVATAEVIALLGLTPVLVDVKRDTFNVDADAIEAAITSRTKAIVPIHLFGQCADMERIMGISRKYGLYVIEDTAQAIGSDFRFADGSVRKAGTMGHMGATSFFPSKNLGCYGDGGAMMTDLQDLDLKARQIANHGQTRQYYHDMVGVNSRLDTIQAAILDIKLRHLERYNGNRRIAADFYDNAFSSNDRIITPVRDSRSKHVFHQYTLRLVDCDRFGLQEFLKSRGIPAMVYYPVALHMQKAYRDERYAEGAFPVTEKLCSEVISLPMHSELDNEQLEFIASSVLEFFK